MAGEDLAMLIGSVAGDPITLVLAIIAASFVLEDAAVVATGAATARGLVPFELALLALVAGTTIGDMALHVAGRGLARTGFGGRLRADPRTMGAEAWLKDRAVPALAMARIVPGTRLPTYLASGFIRLPLGRTALIVFLASLVWVPALLLLSDRVAAFAPAVALLLLVAALIAPRLIKERAA